MNDFDELWKNGPRLKRDKDSFRLSTDSVLLGDFTNIKKNSRILDLGSGAGVLSILLAAKCESANVMGIEIQSEFAALSRENIAENQLDGRIQIITADLREHRNLVEAGSFDVAVSNPPYFAKNSGFTAPESPRAAAREELFCSLEDICQAAKWALRWGGTLSMVHRPERLSELICTMTAAGIEPKRLRLVQHSANAAPNLILIEGRRGGAAGLTVEPPLILTDDSGADTHEVQRIYRRQAQ